MANVNWNVRADKTPAVQGGIDGSTHHLGPVVPAVFKLSDLPTSGTAGPKLKLPAGTVPTGWSLYLLENGLGVDKGATVTFASGSGTLASGAVSGETTATSGSGTSGQEGYVAPRSAALPTSAGVVAKGRVASGEIVSGEEAFVVPTVDHAVTPGTDGDALILLVVNVEVIDRSKVYLW